MSSNRNPIVFANPVSDLTLARYLAAMEVDYFGIDLSEPDELKISMLIQQIKQWVEGPQLIGVQGTEAKNNSELFSLDGYYVDFKMELPKDSIVFESQQFFINNPNSNPDYVIIESPTFNLPDRECILKVSIYNDPFKQGDFSGYMISPEKEEKIGLYDFETLDAWFEKLRKEKD